MTDRDDTLLAAALLAQTGAARGPEPDDAELRAWSRQALAEPRRGEVESHLACNGRLLERALALANDTAPRRAPRVWPALAAAAAVGAVAVALTVLVRVDPGPAVDAGPPIYRAARAPHPDWRVEAFRRGFAAAEAGARAQVEDLVTTPCLDGDCSALAATLARFGAVLADASRACAQTGAPPAGLASRIADLAVTMDGALELAAWRRDARRLRLAAGGSADGGCAALESLRAERID